MSLKTEAQKFGEKLNSPGKQHVGLRFPLDLDTRGTQNIIRFKIALPSGSKYLANGQYKAMKGKNGQTQRPVYRSKQARASIARRMSENYVMTTTHIDLYMPPQVQTSYTSNWKTTELGSIGAAIDAAGGLWNSNSFTDAMQSIVAYMKANFVKGTIESIGGAIQGITPMNVKDATQIYTSSMKNPYMEVMFNGVENRTFSFTFKFIPRNNLEQQTVRRIIQAFAFNSAPEFSSDQNNTYLTFPSEFDIEFIHKGKENPWLFKISTCALTNVEVNHSPDGQYANHSDGSPFATELTLSFTEMERLTKKRLQDGY